MFVYWCLLGDYERDGPKASPAYRFVQLHRLIAKRGWPARASSVEHLFSLWSRNLKLSAPKEGIAYTRRIIGRLSDQIRSAGEHDEITWKEEISKLATAVLGIRDASYHMISCFERDPLQYIVPLRYLNGLHHFVNPFVRTILKLEADFSQFSGDLSEAVPGLEWFIPERAGGTMISFVEAAKLSQHQFVGRKDAIELAALTTLIDVLFRNGAIYRPEARASLQIFFQDSQIIPKKLLGIWLD